MRMFRACSVAVLVLCLVALARPAVFAARPAQIIVSDTPTPSVTPTEPPAVTPSDTPTSTALTTPTDTPTLSSRRVPTPTRTATPSPPVAEPMVSLTGFYARSARGVSNSVRVGTVTLSITIEAARPTTSPIQLGWSISNGQSILAHHQIHTHGWVGTRTFTWNHAFTAPGSFICIGVARFAGRTQVRALALDVSK